jgi:hypothetical protein
MLRSIKDKKTHLPTTRTALKTKMTKLCNVLDLSQTQNESLEECWTTLFDHYFDILKVSHLYMVEINTCFREIVEPNSRDKPREIKKTLLQNLVQIKEEDLKK